MWRQRANFLTSVSWFGAIAMIASCEVANMPGTSLAGPTACEGSSCGSGQLCRVQFAGIDAGVGSGLDATCIDIPAGCTVFDCSGSACPPCVASMCEVAAISVTERTLSCLGE